MCKTKGFGGKIPIKFCIFGFALGVSICPFSALLRVKSKIVLTKETEINLFRNGFTVFSVSSTDDSDDNDRNGTTGIPQGEAEDNDNNSTVVDSNSPVVYVVVGNDYGENVVNSEDDEYDNQIYTTESWILTLVYTIRLTWEQYFRKYFTKNCCFMNLCISTKSFSSDSQ